MTRPPLDVPYLLALLVASDMEATRLKVGDRMPASETLQKQLWLQRHALIQEVADATPFMRPAAPIDPDQLELL